jgi:hypothetical protein
MMAVMPSLCNFIFMKGQWIINVLYTMRAYKQLVTSRLECDGERKRAKELEKALANTQESLEVIAKLHVTKT